MDMTIPIIIWAAGVMAAAGGIIAVFRAEDRHEINRLRSDKMQLQGELKLERDAHLRTKARLSQLMPVPEDILERHTSPLTVERELSPAQQQARKDLEAKLLVPSDEPYDQERDRGRTQVKDWQDGWR